MRGREQQRQPHRETKIEMWFECTKVPTGSNSISSGARVRFFEAAFLFSFQNHFLFF